VRPDPFSSVPTTLRLWLAALLAAAAPTANLLSNDYGVLTPGFILPSDCGYSTGPFCTPGAFVPGSFVPGTLTTANQAQLRLLVWGSVVVLALVASRRRTLASRRVARLASLGLVGALAVGLSERSSLVVLLLTGALLLAAPPLWRRERGSPLR
jgi:hypothetical protein